MKSKRSSSGKSFPPLGPDTKVFVVWVERFDDIGRLIFLNLLSSKKGESKARKNFIISSKLIDKLERHYCQLTV